MKGWTPSKRARRWLIVGGALMLTAALVTWNWQGINIWYHMVPIRPVPQVPAFDLQKAKTLSPERRAELERELFSELRMWNGESRRYQGVDARRKREQRWLAMAAEGYELAYLTLKVLPPDSFARDPRPTLKRLEELAQQGDAGAMCLYGGIVFELPYWVTDWTPQEERGRMWVLKGAELGHPECLIRLGGWRMSGYVSPANNKQGSEMIYEALRKGYDYYVGSLWLRARELNYLDSPTRKLVYCWSYLDAAYRKNEPDLSLDVYINGKAPAAERARLNHELDQLRQWHPSIEDCIKLNQQLFGE